MREQINTEKMNEEHIRNRMHSIKGEMEEREKKKKSWKKADDDSAADL